MPPLREKSSSFDAIAEAREMFIRQFLKNEKTLHQYSEDELTFIMDYVEALDTAKYRLDQMKKTRKVLDAVSVTIHPDRLKHLKKKAEELYRKWLTLTTTSLHLIG